MESNWAMALAGQTMTAAASSRKIAFLMKAKTTFAVLLATMAAAVAFAFVQRAVPVPAPAPDVRFATLAGERFSTADLRGKVVLVNFWATYCGPCLREMPKVLDAHRKFAPRGYETVAVAVRQDRRERVADFAQRGALPFKVVYDASGEIARHFDKVRITPSIFVLDRQGRVLMKAVGAPDWAAVHAAVEKAL
jgi:peroxiredoxin